MPGRQVDYTLPAAHALQLAELVKAAGIAPEELFAGLGLDARSLAVPGAQISVATGEELFQRARQLTGEPAVGIQLGLQMRASAHGYLGFAAMTSSTLREALEIGHPLRSDAHQRTRAEPPRQRGDRVDRDRGARDVRRRA